MNTKFLIIAGAGSTLSDALSKPAKRRPPLDKGFFARFLRRLPEDVIGETLRVSVRLYGT